MKIDRKFFKSLFSIFIILFFCGAIYYFRDEIKKLENFGYLGIFLISMFANASIVLPLPGVALTFSMGFVFDPFFVAIAAGLGSGIGELTGYLLGFFGQSIGDNTNKYYLFIEKKMKESSTIIIFLLAAIPNPLFDIAGILAGVYRIPVAKFLFWTCLGKIIKMLFFAYSGSIISHLQ
jgi:membrane protein YqaA with SNARE-associated domain